MNHDNCADIIRIKNIVCGNGKRGLKDMVDDHEEYIQQQRGSFGTIKWLLGFVGISNIALVVKIFIFG